MAPYNPAATTGISDELKERLGEPSYNFKSSAALLIILNRIWTLEEQHASNVSLVKALNSELVHSRSKIKELLKDQQESRREIDELMNQLSQDNRARNSKEKEGFKASLQSVRDEMEDERNLRKRSESLHRKLARELFDIKSTEERKRGTEIVSCGQIETRNRDFSHPPQTANLDSKDTEHKESRLRRRSLESIPEFGTTPKDSAFSDARCKEISKVGPSHYEEQEEHTVSGRRLGQSPPSFQMSDHQNTAREIAGEGTPTEISMLQKSDIYDSYQKKSFDEGHGSNSKTVDKLLSDLLLSGGGCLPPEYHFKESDSSNSSALRRHASPDRQWMTNMKPPGPRISESPSKPQSARENSLKAKLQEPKSKRSRSRLKILKGSS